MVYLRSTLRYFLTFLRITFLLCVLLLICLFSGAISLKSQGDPAFFIDSLKNYGIIIIRIMPFIIILSSLIFFSNISKTAAKPFLITMIPFLTIFNTLILCLSFFISADFREFDGQARTYYYPELAPDAVNNLGEYKIVMKGGGNKGVLFYNNAYLFKNFKLVNGNISLDTGTAILDSSLTPSYTHYSFPSGLEAIGLEKTGISDYVIKNFLDASRNLPVIFSGLSTGSSIAALIISFLFMNLGFFAMACSFAVFFNDKQTILLSWSVIVLLSAVLFLILPQYFILISIIKSGIRNAQFKLILPSIFVGLPGGLIGYILIGLKMPGPGRKAA